MIQAPYFWLQIQAICPTWKSSSEVQPRKDLPMEWAKPGKASQVTAFCRLQGIQIPTNDLVLDLPFNLQCQAVAVSGRPSKETVVETPSSEHTQ